MRETSKGSCLVEAEAAVVVVVVVVAEAGGRSVERRGGRVDVRAIGQRTLDAPPADHAIWGRGGDGVKASMLLLLLLLLL